MLPFLLRRLVQALVVMAFVSVLSFVMLKMIPGDEAKAILGPQATQQAIEAYRAKAGLDQGVLTQFVRYLGRLLHGDLGTSITYNVPVTELITQRLPRSGVLFVLATGLALVIGVPIGVLQGARRNGAVDYVLTALIFLFYAMPVFLLAMLLILVFAVKVPILPPTGPSGSTVGEILAQPANLVLPVVTVALLTLALFSRYVRASVIDNLAEDYVRTARAKGLPERQVLFGHVLRNSLLPLISLLGLMAPGILAGTMITEYVFNFPGMGLLFYESLQQYDFAPVLATILLVSAVTVLGNLLADIGYAVLDPRIRDGAA